MNVIFLDVDGVLNDQDFIFDMHKRKEIEISRDKLLLLKDIIIATGGRIVLSSSWRIGLVKKDGKVIGECSFNKEFLELLKEYGIEIYDITPSFGNRSLEIKHYLENNKDIDNYVVLDDEDLDFVNQVRTDFFNGGLTEERSKLAIDILRKKR